MGDKVMPGDVLAAIETDKATVDFEMQEEGYVAALLFPEGAKDVTLGKVVAILVEELDDVSAFKNYSPEADAGAAEASAPSAPAQQETPAATSASSAPVASAPRADGSRVFVSPLARKLAEEKGYSLDQIPGTGPHNRIIAADVKEFTPQAKPAAKPAAAASKTQPAAATELPSIAFDDLENS